MRTWSDLCGQMAKFNKASMAKFLSLRDYAVRLFDHITSQKEEDYAICEEIRRNFRTNCVVMGDFNLKGYEGGGAAANESLISEYRQLFEEELFMHQYVTEPTRQESILDLVFSDNKELIRRLTVNEGLGNSDHDMVKFYMATESRPKDNFHRVPNFNPRLTGVSAERH